MRIYLLNVLIVILADIYAMLRAHTLWTNHYLKLDYFGHNVYLEQQNLPNLWDEPMGPTPAPNGHKIAFESLVNRISGLHGFFHGPDSSAKSRNPLNPRFHA